MKPNIHGSKDGLPMECFDFYPNADCTIGTSLRVIVWQADGWVHWYAEGSESGGRARSRFEAIYQAGMSVGLPGLAGLSSTRPSVHPVEGRPVTTGGH